MLFSINNGDLLERRKRDWLGRTERVKKYEACAYLDISQSSKLQRGSTRSHYKFDHASPKSHFCEAR